MKLQFRGQTYFTTDTEVKTVPTEHTACFRGQKYQIRVPVMPDNSQKSQISASIRKYRGVNYIVEHRTFPNSPSREVCYR